MLVTFPGFFLSCYHIGYVKAAMKHVLSEQACDCMLCDRIWMLSNSDKAALVWSASDMLHGVHCATYCREYFHVCNSVYGPFRTPNHRSNVKNSFCKSAEREVANACSFSCVQGACIYSFITCATNGSSAHNRNKREGKIDHSAPL